MLKKINYLFKGLNKKSGRNNRGKITVYHKGGGNKNLYRFIDYKRINVKGKVIDIQYDPNRSANIALMYNSISNKFFYILAPKDVNKNDILLSYNYKDINITKKIKNGYSMSLYDIPLNTYIHNIELHLGKGGSLVKTAGNYGIIIKKDENINGFADIKFKNKRIKKISLKCKATIGTLSNENFNLKKYKKAGKKRNLNIRPTVRGVAMNPIDHPHGGGEGKTSGGRVSVTPWGIITKGKKTVLYKKHLNL